ncbi:MAG: DUF1800 domain-containing protein [Fibrella sp.]|nr:DUF1800 domain-containing protein [Armatimonadota bacterium]
MSLPVMSALLGVTLILATATPVVAQRNSSNRNTLLADDLQTSNLTSITVPDAIRFLEQCTFGPTKSDIARVQEIGYEAFIDEQFAAPMSNYNYLYYEYGGRGLKVRFIQNAVRKPDQLRQRVAFALSQVLVVNSTDGVFDSTERVAAMLPYQNALLKQGLGNYRDLMYEITLTPAMGAYLNMLNNAKPNAATNSRPNENFARELLQLFTLGVYLLNDNGTVKTDPQGNPLPSYDNAEVTEFSRVFTGWTFAPRAGNSFNGFIYYPRNYAVPMTLWAPQHDTGAKTLLRGQTLPALGAGIPTNTNNPALKAYAQNELNVAMDNIFAHPNLPPFVVTRMIQHLVTANPSPSYINRVVQVFKNNGQNVRGDMKAVVKAILLDNEARNAIVARSTEGYGHWRSGVLYITNLLRQFEAQGDLAGIENWGTEMGQNPMSPPSVFSFYRPEYRIIALNGVPYGAPEMQTFTTATAIRRINFANNLIRNGVLTGSSLTGKTQVTSINLSDYQAIALDTTALINLVNERLLHGEMSAAMRTQVANAVNAIPVTDTAANRLSRARTALYLVAASQDYQVQR